MTRLRKWAGPVVLAAVLAVGSPTTTAGAGRSQPAYASISAVEPEFVGSGVDSYGSYCEYRASVTLSWSGTIRLWVSQFVDGQRQAPGEVTLKGSGDRVTVVVERIGARAGTSGPLVAEAQILTNRNRTWKVIDSEASRDEVTCAVA